MVKEKLNCYCPNVDASEVIDNKHILCNGINPNVTKSHSRRGVKKDEGTLSVPASGDPNSDGNEIQLERSSPIMGDNQLPPIKIKPKRRKRKSDN